MTALNIAEAVAVAMGSNNDLSQEWRPEQNVSDWETVEIYMRRHFSPWQKKFFSAAVHTFLTDGKGNEWEDEWRLIASNEAEGLHAKCLAFVAAMGRADLLGFKAADELICESN